MPRATSASPLSAAAALLLAAAAPLAARAAYCGGSPDPNAQPNALPVWSAAPTLLREVANGKLFAAGDVAGGYNFSLVHVYGSAYEMGFAQGALLPDACRFIETQVWAYMEEQVEEAVDFLPPALQQLIADLGLDLALDVLLNLTAPYTGAYFMDELHGIADGSGADFQTLARIHLIGELTQGDCSMVGAWGKATAGGKTLTLRALDWDTDGECGPHARPRRGVLRPHRGAHSLRRGAHSPRRGAHRTALLTSCAAPRRSPRPKHPRADQAQGPSRWSRA